MQKTAVGVLAAGLVFVFFRIETAGIDLLMDPVGFLVVYNAARALRSSDKRMGIAAWCSLVLVGVSSLQLFIPAGLAASLLALACVAGQALLLVLLGLAMGHILAGGGQKKIAWPVRLAFFGTTATGITAAALPAAATYINPVMLALQAATLVSLLFACILPRALLY